MLSATALQLGPVRLGASQITTAPGSVGAVTEDCHRNRPYIAGWKVLAKVGRERRDDGTRCASEKNRLATECRVVLNKQFRATAEPLQTRWLTIARIDSPSSGK